MSDYPVLRMSHAANCLLRQSYELQQQDSMSFDSMMMDMGTALEPVVVGKLEKLGLNLMYTLDNQLELEWPDLPLQGHPDGIVQPFDGEPSEQLVKALPARALRVLGLQQDPMLLEIKTMNDNTFKQFERAGLGAGAYTQLYLTQISFYMAGLAEYVDPVPMEALVVGVSRSSGRFHYEVIPYDEYLIVNRVEQLRELYELYLAGEEPDPEYDGSAPYCFSCPYRHICPARQEYLDILYDREDEEDEELTPTQVAEIDTLAAEYRIKKEQHTVIGDEVAELKIQLHQVAPLGSPRTTDRFSVKTIDVLGRQTVDLDFVANELKMSKQHLPKVRGSGHTRIQVREVS